MKFPQLVGALASILSICSPVLAQLPTNAYNPSQFIQLGTITGMTLNDAPLAGESALLKGGSITVDGLLIIVPDNTMATLPAVNVAWPELFSASGVPQINIPSVWKATVFGNRITNAAGVDQFIAGLVYLSQDSLRSLTGFVTSIDPTTGQFTLAGGFKGQAGAAAGGIGGITCVINDPLGVYYAGPTKYTANPLWSVDPANPSIRSATGYPMCIPGPALASGKEDPNCPSKNRPKNTKGVYLTSFTFPDPALVAKTPTLPDPMFKAPIVVGDYVTIVGQWAGPSQPSTGSTTPLFEVNGLSVNIELLTARGTKPAYVTVESALFGITLPVSPDQPETRAVAFVTDPSQSLEWLAQDINPCTGAITERSIMVIAPQDPLAGGAAPAGRSIFRLGKTPFSPPPKNSVFRLSAGTLQTNGAGAPGDPTVGGILAGQFVNPTFDFTFPEVIPFGAPLVQLQFDNLEFLLKGAGPYVPGNPLTPAITGANGPPRIGRLNPWPGQLTPGTPNNPACPAGPVPQPPTQAPPTPAPAPAPATPPKKVDTVKVISVTTVRGKGGFDIITAVATSSDLTAILTANLVASIAIPDTNMPFNAATKQWSVDLQEKGVATIFNVISNLGGKACFNFNGVTPCVPA